MSDPIEPPVVSPRPSDALILQRNVTAWAAERFPDHRDIWKRLAKLTEEVGELNRALIGLHEGREGRGDPVQELAQVGIVAMVLASVLGVDLLEEMIREYERVTGDKLTQPDNRLYSGL